MYSVIGISSRHCSPALFGRLALQANQISARLQVLRQQWPEHQFYLLSTCHRLELYSYGPMQPMHRALRAWLQALGLDSHTPYYAYWGRQAVQHLFQVAAGLESIIPGDDQVVQQVRQAYQIAAQSGAVGTALHGLIQAALMSAKRVRTTTQLNRGHQSIPSAGIQMAIETLGTLHQKTALIVGAGDTSLRCAQIIHKQGGRLYFLNRTQEKAVQLAEQFGGEAIRSEDLPRMAASLDLITLAIDADRPVHDYRQWLNDIKQAVVWVDLSMPAQVDASYLPDHHCYIDLPRIARRQELVLDHRKAEIPKAAATIQQQVDNFLKKQAQRMTQKNKISIQPLNLTHV